MIKAHIRPAVLLTLLFTVLTGAVFPLLVWIPSQILFSGQANGSLITREGKLVGSSLIGQSFSAPRYFHSRSSAAGAGYDPTSSGGTNLGPTSKKLFQGQPDDPATPNDESFAGVAALAKTYRDENALDASAILPADAVTRSASGLDPHISPQNAQLQASRVARERGLKVAVVMTLIDKFSEGRFLNIFGENRVNVLKLNLELDRTRPGA